MRAGDRDAVADVEEGVVVGPAEILLQHEFFARRQQEGALVAIVQQVLVAHHGLEAVEPFAEILGVFAALGDAPGDEFLAIVHRRVEIERVRRRHVRQRQPGRKARAEETGRAGKKFTSPHRMSPR